MVIYNFNNLPKSQRNGQSRFKVLSNTKWTHKKYFEGFQLLSKVVKFGQYVHTAVSLVKPFSHFLIKRLTLFSFCFLVQAIFYHRRSQCWLNRQWVEQTVQQWWRWPPWRSFRRGGGLAHLNSECRWDHLELVAPRADPATLVF